MPDFADQLLFALSAWSETPWPKYVQTFDGIFADTASAPQQPVWLRRWKAASVLSALGHIEQRANGGAITVAPAALAQLPQPGIPRAVLCGRRAPTTTSEARDAGRPLGVRVDSSLPRARNRYAPPRIQVCARDTEAIAALADHLGILYLDVPPAWSLAECAGSAVGYLAQLQWHAGEELDWERVDFVADRLRFVANGVTEPTELRLSRYKNPSTGASLTRLWSGSDYAEADISWGRFTVLKAARKQAVSYDERRFILRTPVSIPLPTILARALTLCTGFAAAEVASGPNACYEFAGVPPDVAQTVLEKLGQGSTA